MRSLERCRGAPHRRVRKGRERATTRHDDRAAQHARARCPCSPIHPRKATRAFHELVHKTTRRSGHRLCLPPTPHARRGRSKITGRRTCVRVPRAARASADPPTRHVLPQVNSSHCGVSRGAEVLLRPPLRRGAPVDREECREQNAVHRRRRRACAHSSSSPGSARPQLRAHKSSALILWLGDRVRTDGH